MSLTLEKSVRELALENPTSIRVFESLGIDYCCGGKRPLSEACAHSGIETSHVLHLLEKADQEAQLRPDPNAWATQPLGAVINHIVDSHHAYVRRETPRIQALLARVVQRHGLLHPEVPEIDRLFAAMSQELATHMLKEEQVLFPYVAEMEQTAAKAQACFGSVDRPIANMRADHDDAAALLARIRTLANGFQPPANACPTYVGLYSALSEFEANLEQHVYLENNILFPRAIQLEQAL